LLKSTLVFTVYRVLVFTVYRVRGGFSVPIAVCRRPLRTR